MTTLPPGVTPSMPSRPAAAMPPPVEAAVITRVSEDTVWWVDAEAVPDGAGTTTIVQLSGAAHGHSAPISPDVQVFLPFDSQGQPSVDGQGIGTAPGRRLEIVVHDGGTQTAPRLTFDDQGRVSVIQFRAAKP
jgi:hypothetical protein